MVQDLSRQIKKALKKQILENGVKQKYTKYNASLTWMVKQNTMDGHMKKNQFLLQPSWISEPSDNDNIW